uniref:Neur_chan_LBD domain-containing protein n=1 Tax=Heterorhabditis bacteriophora TaxID=37862 RepID=A0A1I7X4T1_HETBA
MMSMCRCLPPHADEQPPVYDGSLASGNRIRSRSMVRIYCLAQSKALRSRRIGTEGQVVSRLFADYDPNTRPPVRGCLPAHTSFILCLKENADHSSILVITNIFINRVRWHEDRAEVDLYLRQQWEDGRLQYEVDPREEIEQVPVPSNRKLWVPDTYFSTANELSKGEHRSALVEPSGYVRASEQCKAEGRRDKSTTKQRENRWEKSYCSSDIKDDRWMRDQIFVSVFRETRNIKTYNYPLEDIVYLWANSPPLVNPVEKDKKEAVAGIRPRAKTLSELFFYRSSILCE